MQGLLDFIKTPEGQGLLSGVFGYAANARKGAPINSLGRGGLAGLMGYSNAIDREQQAQEASVIKDFRTMQMGEMQRRMEQQKAQEEWRKNLPGMIQQSQTTYGAGDEGPTMTPGNPQALQSYLMRPESPFADDLVKRQLFPKEEEAFTLGEGQVRYKGGQVVAQGPQKTADLPSDVRAYQFAQQQGYKGSFQDWVLSQKRASAPSMAVNLSDPTAVGKAGLDFQDKYRAATKPSFARAQAYNAMQEASLDPSPKGDLTMVYSFIKALDPESVVREGEIGLVNANRSIPDTVKGYAQRLASGQSLLPDERADLLKQARTLSYTDFQRSRNDIRAYRDNAERLGLDPDLYAPDPYAGIDFMRVRKPGSPVQTPWAQQPAQNDPKDPLGLFKR